MTNLKIEQIKKDKRFQPRDQLDGSHINNLKELYTDGHELPPVTVWLHQEKYFLCDGFHRTRAAELAGLKELPVTVLHFESEEEAMAFSFKANNSHGLNMNRGEKVKYLSSLLKKEPFLSMSSRKAGAALGVSHMFVQRLRKKESNSSFFDNKTNSEKMGSDYFSDCSESFINALRNYSRGMQPPKHPGKDLSDCEAISERLAYFGI